MFKYFLIFGAIGLLCSCTSVDPETTTPSDPAPVVTSTNTVIISQQDYNALINGANTINQSLANPQSDP